MHSQCSVAEYCLHDDGLTAARSVVKRGRHCSGTREGTARMFERRPEDSVVLVQASLRPSAPQPAAQNSSSNMPAHLGLGGAPGDPLTGLAGSSGCVSADSLPPPAHRCGVRSQHDPQHDSTRHSGCSDHCRARLPRLTVSRSCS